MKKTPLKKLATAVLSIMAMITTSVPTYASDIEIYQASTGGTTTLMLMLDVSGSMNVGHSAHDDFNLRAGDGPQAGNDKTYIPTPLLDQLERLNPQTFRRTRDRRGQITGTYTQAMFNNITNWGTVNRTQAQAQLNLYLNWSPNSYCQTARMGQYAAQAGDTSWEQRLITERNAEGRGYDRQYCKVPVDATTIDQKYWSNAGGTAVGASWIMDPIIGCPVYQIDENGRNNPHRRCYSRIDRVKDALWDVINGNPAKGITPLGDNIVLGISTLGLGMDNTSVPWSANNPLSSGAGRWFHRDLGAIRVPARPLSEKVNNVSQRELLNNYIRSITPIASTPTARSYTETASYMLGTTTLPNDRQLRETDLIDTGTGGHRSCRTWGTTPIAVPNSTLTVLPCTEWEYATNNNGGNSSWQMIDGYPIANDRFTGRHRLANTRQPNGQANNYTGADELIWVSRTNGRIFFSYGRLSPTGFPMSSVDSKDPNDPTKYKAPDSLLNQAKPECNGQGIYVLSDGQPSGRPGELAQMKLALGNKGSAFTCGGGFSDIVGQADGLQNDWQCMFSFAETLLNPATNPLNISFKTAAVGFAREYTQGGLPAYDPTLGDGNQAERIKLNLARVPTTNTSDIANFARWGIRGDGGWYSGSSSQSVVDSINSFVATLTKDIPDTVTGQPAIPIDPLNPLVLMNQGFYGTFIPKVGVNKSFWAGNMNKYDVKNSGLYGQNNTPLFNTDGKINANAVGLWGKDGMASKLPLRNAQRQLFTNESTDTNQALTSVTVAELYGQGSLGADTANRNAWLNLLGYNIPLTNTPANQADLPATTELRQLGALLHSTPIVLTQQGKIDRSGSSLNTKKDRQDYVLYGSTQGILHVVDSQTGVEKVAFVPKEMMANQKDSFQHNDNANSAMKYGIDGQWTAYTQYVSDGDGFTVNKNTGATSTDLSGKGVQWVYGGLRMGGRSYYALDLTDINTPKLKFHINPDGAAAGTPLSYMGQSWSKPTLGFVNWKGTRRLVMFVGGGYDDGYENRTYDQTNSKGAGVYMFDAHDGTLLWWGSSHATTSIGTSTGTTPDATNNPNLQYSVVSEISTFDRNNDGLIDHLLFGDLGGQVFRVDLDNAHAAADGLVTRIVRLYNGHQAGGLSPRFYETPSLSAHTQDGVAGQFGIVSIASGNRSSPLAEGAESAKDALFVLFDYDILKAATAKKGVTLKTPETGILTTITKDIMTGGNNSKDIKEKAEKDTKANTYKGWTYPLSGTAGKLKGYSSPRVVDNLLFLTTYSPDGGTVDKNSCNAGIRGESFQEIFCLPWGVCKDIQRTLLDSFVVTTNKTQDGSKYRIELGVGTVQAAVGRIDDKDGGNQYGTISPKSLDCSKKENQDKLECLTEIANISNKPVRWYETDPKTK